MPNFRYSAYYEVHFYIPQKTKVLEMFEFGIIRNQNTRNRKVKKILSFFFIDLAKKFYV